MAKNIFFFGGMVVGVVLTLFTASLIPLDKPSGPDDIRHIPCKG